MRASMSFDFSSRESKECKIDAKNFRVRHNPKIYVPSFRKLPTRKICFNFQVITFDWDEFSIQLLCLKCDTNGWIGSHQH